MSEFSSPSEEEDSKTHTDEKDKSNFIADVIGDDSGVSRRFIELFGNLHKVRAAKF